MSADAPLITNDAVVLGILLAILAFVFSTGRSEHPFWKKFYKYVPSLLLCYFLPSLLSTFGVISGEKSKLYFVASQYLLPASLVLLTVSIDLKAILRLGPKALLLFLTATVGVVIGGPLSLFLVSLFDPSLLADAGADTAWKGLSTIAGSWIGGGANQTALKEVFLPSDRLFSVMIAVDVIVANLWMAALLFAAGKSKEIDAKNGADASAIEEVKARVEAFQQSHAKIPALPDMILVLAVAFGVTALSHAAADVLAPWIETTAPSLASFSLTSKFFWVVVLATTGGLLLSFVPSLRALEGVGASRMGSVFLYILVATIGMKMDILAIVDHPEMFLVGLIWILFHGVLLIVVARLSKAPVFFLAVGSQANIGGAASAPVVASAFHPSLAPVGVLLAVFGYALGTYGGWISAQLMRLVSGG